MRSPNEDACSKLRPLAIVMLASFLQSDAMRNRGMHDRYRSYSLILHFVILAFRLQLSRACLNHEKSKFATGDTGKNTFPVLRVLINGWMSFHSALFV